MRIFLKIAKVLGGLACAAGCLWFLLPILHGGFALGAAFGFGVCAFAFFLLCISKKMAALGGWRKVCLRVLEVVYAVGLLWAGYLTVLMFSAQYRTPPEQANVLVLGAQVYSAERMGVSLSNRVDKAYEYLAKHPTAKCIVTGGQGSNEPCPEAVTEKNALTRMGIDPDRIYLEDRSRNTRENMNFSKTIAEKEGLGTEFAVVTQGFHMFRALMLAENAGFTAYSLVAETDPIIFPEYYGRELLSLTKWHVEQLFMK